MLSTTARVERDGAEIFIDGMDYLDVLARLHARFRPRTYFEIGALYGDTLKLASCATVVVDPQLQFPPSVAANKPRFETFEMTSDAFFAAHDPSAVLGAPIDLAFLDGMHEFPFLLRDFIGAEKACARHGMIVMHDCLPRDAWQSRRHAELYAPGEMNYPGWAGDVWKMTPMLRALRPDLKITVLDAPPTGLVVVSNLDPDSTVLQDRYEKILSKWDPVVLDRPGSGWTMRGLFDAAQIQSGAAWVETVAPAHPVSLIDRAMGALRRRLGMAEAA